MKNRFLTAAALALFVPLAQGQGEWGKPDLAVFPTNFHTFTIHANEKAPVVSVDCAVANLGNADAGPFVLVYEMRDPNQPNVPGYVVGHELFDGMGAMEYEMGSSLIHLPKNLPPGAKYDIVAVVDAFEEIDEYDETNNEEVVAICRVSALFGGPDVAVGIVKVGAGGATTIEVTNVGNRVAEQVSVSVTLDTNGTVVFSASLGSIDPGQTVTAGPFTPTAQNAPATVKVDCLGDVHMPNNYRKIVFNPM